MNWSGMGVREYAAALFLSPYALRKWRDRLDESEAAIDWRAHLHPSARPLVGTSASQSAAESSLTGAAKDDARAPPTPARRFFSDEQKLAKPKAHSSGGKEGHIGITKQVDGYIRRLLVVCATQENARKVWASRLLAGKQPKVVAVALASTYAKAASTADSPSMSTAVRISTICRLPSSAPVSLRPTLHRAGSSQSLNGALLRRVPGLRAPRLY